MRIVWMFVGLIGLAVLAGCATLSQAECEAGDWRSLGTSDGANGYPASYIDNHISACSEFGVAVDRQLYEAGRQEGLRSYCRLDNAASRGRAGQSYAGVCTGEVGVSFRVVYEEARNVDDVSDALGAARTQLDTALDQITDPATTDVQRQTIRIEIVRLQSEISRLESELRRAEDRLAGTLAFERGRLAAQDIIA